MIDLKTISVIIILYAIQMLLTGLVSTILGSSGPSTVWEFIKMTFAPYMIFNFKKHKIQ